MVHTKSRKNGAKAASHTAAMAMPAPLPTPNSSGVLPSRRHLMEIRVIQKNLVYVIGISARIASETVLKEPSFFGQFGKVVKIVVNRRNTGAPLPADRAANSGATTTSGSAYVTYARAEDAVRAIAHVDGSVFDGRILRATYGTTKYCSFFLRGVNCPNPGCMYLHEEGESTDSYTKEELSSGYRGGPGSLLFRKMHLHSNLVDKSEITSLRQFGSVMYRPLSPSVKVITPPPVPVPAATTSPLAPVLLSASLACSASALEELSSQSRPNSTSTSSSAGSSYSHAHPNSASNSLTVKSPNFAQYEEEALTFLNRLARWNHSIDIEVEPLRSPRTLLQTNSEASTFDPFSETSSATLLKRPGSWQETPKSPEQPIAPRLFETGPMIANGVLPGFNWTGLSPADSLLQSSPSQSLTHAQQSESVVTFKKPINHQPPRPAPVGSPPLAQPPTPSQRFTASPFGPTPQWNNTINGSVPAEVTTAPGFEQCAAPAPVVSPNLEHLFGFYSQAQLHQSHPHPHPQPQNHGHYSSQEYSTSGGLQNGEVKRRIVDANILESQFFHNSRQLPNSVPADAREALADARRVAPPQQPPSNSLIKFNQVAAASAPSPPLYNATPIKSAHLHPASSTAAPATGGSPVANIKKNVLRKEAASGDAFAIKNGTLPTRKVGPVAIKPTATSASLALVGKAGLGSGLSANSNANSNHNYSTNTATSIPTASLSAPIQSSNHFALLDDGTGNDVSSSDSEKDQLPPWHTESTRRDSGQLDSEVGRGGQQRQEQQGQGQVQKQKLPAKSAEPSATGTAPVPTAATKEPAEISRKPPPYLQSQPEYQLAWGSAANGYTPPKAPVHLALSEEDLQAWKKWLADDLKATRHEEQKIRHQVSKLHTDICQWISSFATVV